MPTLYRRAIPLRDKLKIFGGYSSKAVVGVIPRDWNQLATARNERDGRLPRDTLYTGVLLRSDRRIKEEIDQSNRSAGG